MSYFTREKDYIFQTYKRNHLLAVKGRGKYIWDEKGRKYLDFLSGISVSSVGHCNPKITAAIKKQCEKLIHVSNLYYTKPQTELAELISMLSFGGKVFFSNSGAEAVECAIKLARKWGNEVKSAGKKVKSYEIITFKESFHGRTMATLSATGQPKFHKGFEPMLEGFKYADFNDIASVKKLISAKTCAIMVEPVQGEGGIRIADKAFLKGLKELCRKHNLLLVFDEIQCGLGRTGKIFAYKNYGIEPDIMTLAKSLGGGLPIGATVAKESIASIFQYGAHGSTFGGNPVCCSAAIEVVKIVSSSAVLRNVEKIGKYFMEKLKFMQKDYKIIKEVRGLGLMTAIELGIEGKEIVKKCLERNFLINCTQDKVLRFLPPLTINKSDIDSALKILKKVLDETAKAS